MVLSSKSQEQRLRSMQPVILIGMHRSGTSLVTRLLRDLGIHMDRRLSRDAESVFFQVLNRRIFGAVGVKWGYVDPLVEAMRSPEFVEQQASKMQMALFPNGWQLGSVGIRNFFGPEKWKLVCEGHAVDWGFKDPRTTLTFPVWMRLFPQARCVHVVRNGVDVAISTHRRSLKQQRKWRNRIFPIDYSPITLDFRYCFQLWETYLAFFYEHASCIPQAQLVEMRYEDLLADPHGQLKQLLAFLEHPVDDSTLSAVSQQVNRERLNNSRHASAYQNQIPALVSSPLMQQLGYGYSIPATGGGPG